jgi:hypothetical protein
MLVPLPAGARAGETVSLRPAAGPPGTLATLRGEGLPAGRAVTVRVGPSVVARGRSDRRGSFRSRLRLPARAAITTRVARDVRAVNHFRPGALAGEVAAPGGLRVRWTPLSPSAGDPVRVTGAGFAPGVPVTIAIAGQRVAVAHPTAAGRFTATIQAAAGRVSVRQGARRLPFTLAAGSGRDLPLPTTPPAAAPPASLSLPIRAAFYYPWFPESWTEAGTTPFTKFNPTLGFYDSSSVATIARHLDELAYAHVQAAIASWWGQGRKTDQRLPTILQTTHAAGSPVRWAVYYEAEGSGDPSVGQIRDDLRYLRDRYAGDPAYLRINGRFVVFVYGQADDGCRMVDRWHLANAGIGAYVVLKVGAAQRACTFRPDGWHAYAPDRRTAAVRGHAFSISPGFWLASEPGPRLGRDITCFRRAIRDMVASRAPWQLITTFDEWAEGTSVEPATQWASTSGYGDYLDALHDGGAGQAASSPC